MDAAHVHLILNHIPVLGTIFGFLVLAHAQVRNSQEVKQLSLVIFVLAALVAIPVYLTGEPAEEVIEHQPRINEDAIEQHEDAALYALIGMEILGLLSLGGLLIYRGNKDFPKGFMISSLVLSVAVIALMTLTATLGGRISHPELQGDTFIDGSTNEAGDDD